ncbi:MAG: hypothetical protein ACREKL_02105, partial [Chthoniobacterales bacterium]
QKASTGAATAAIPMPMRVLSVIDLKTGGANKNQIGSSVSQVPFANVPETQRDFPGARIVL